MLDGLLGRNAFSSKCKSLIKPTKARIEALRRRAEAKQRFLKEDLAKLLANGLDINAYGRTEEFVAGLNLLSCYNFIEQSCEYILQQLSIMQKQGQCPEECRETVASLMFAAARFSDLPELRDLRDVFQDRYGSGLECFVNQVFVEKIASKPLTMERRVKLLQDIAAEFSIQWDSEGFKLRMDKPSTLAPDQAKKLGPPRVSDDKYQLPNGKNTLPESKKCSEERIKHHNGQIGREEKHGYKHETHSEKAETRIDRENCGHFSKPRRESPSKKYGPSIGMNDDRAEALGNGMVNKGTRERHVYKQELLDETIETRENDAHLSKARRESPSKKHGPSIGKNNSPTVVKSSFSNGTANEGRRERHGYKQDQLTNRPEVIETREDDVRLFRARREFTDKKHGSDDTTSSSRDRKLEVLGDDRLSPFLRGERSHSFHRKSEAILNGSRPPSNENSHTSQQNDVRTTGKVQEEETGRLKPCYNNYLPPPYVKSNIPPPYSKPNGQGSKYTVLEPDNTTSDPLPNLRSDRIHKKLDSPYREHGVRGSQNGSNPDHGFEEDPRYQNGIPLPKPRSIRKKHSKSSSSHDDVASSEDARIVKRISSSRRKERKGLQILFDDEHYRGDEEERMMDKLLLHYSKKPSAYDEGKLRRKKSRSNTGGSPSSETAAVVAPPTRSISLPHEQSGELEPKKVYARANSFQPDNQARHVHPKLPDYDDLAARFAALRGR